MRTRFPFRYGIANMTEVPHLFVSVVVEIDGRTSQGMSSDGLPPKWFTKNPETEFEQDDLPAMLRVIRNAGELALEMGAESSFFRWWHRLYKAQLAWARQEGLAPLLAGLGVSLIERAVLDAMLRRLELSISAALHDNVLGIDLASLRPALGRVQPKDVLPVTPCRQVYLRHTVGLGDPLLESSVGSADAVQDGLPHTLQENIDAYGLRYFKIKLSGDVEFDRNRLTEIASLVTQAVGRQARFTLDGNENFQSMKEFRHAWSEFCREKSLREFFASSLLFVEQPIHRSQALEETVGTELKSWVDAPPVIIDESDGDLQCLPRALTLGYRGTSHKNCKGIIKGVLAAATIAGEGQRRGEPLVLSAEDLGNVGPVALMQDLAMVATLGISHVERNGHHYFAGLSMFPDGIQAALLADHEDLFERHSSGFAKLSVRDGILRLASVNRAAFGLKPWIDVGQFDPWEF